MKSSIRAVSFALAGAAMTPCSLLGQSDDQLPFTIAAELTFGTVDGDRIINAASIVFVPGLEVRTSGKVYGHFGVRLFLPLLPFAGSGGDGVEDENGNSGHRTASGFDQPLVRGGIGIELTSGPRPIAVAVEVGQLGLKERNVWLGGAAAFPIRGRLRGQIAYGRDPAWINDEYYEWDSGPPLTRKVLYVKRREFWARTLTMGIRIGR